MGDAGSNVKARIAALSVEEKVKSLLRQLDAEQATEILDRAARAGSDITNLNAYLTNQAKMVLGSDSEDEEDGDADDGSDAENDIDRMREETEPFPALAGKKEASETEQDEANQAKQEAAEAADSKDYVIAILKYTAALKAA